MRGKEKCIIIVLCIALVICIVLLLYNAARPEESPIQPDVEISLRLSTENLTALLEENGIRLTGKARMAMSFIPDTLTFVFDTDTGSADALSGLLINGKKVSYEILSDICENYLDFSCNLVYN